MQYIFCKCQKQPPEEKHRKTPVPVSLFCRPEPATLLKKLGTAFLVMALTIPTGKASGELNTRICKNWILAASNWSFWYVNTQVNTQVIKFYKFHWILSKKMSKQGDSSKSELVSSLQQVLRYKWAGFRLTEKIASLLRFLIITNGAKLIPYLGNSNIFYITPWVKRK